MTIKKVTPTLMFAAALSFSSAGIALSENAAPSETEIRQSYIKHAARAQLHRWYQYYEKSEVGIANQLDVLSEDVTIKSASGTAGSRAQYEAAVKQFPTSWSNSHDLQQSDVTINADGSIRLSAKIRYQNIGMLPEGALRANAISYDMVLKPTNAVLPVFNKIDITTGKAIEGDEFVDLYPQNRLLSLLHYWMALVEDPKRDAAPFKEILVPELDIKFSAAGDTITSFDQLAAWLAGPASAVSASRHTVSNFSYKLLDENRYELKVDLGWHGIRPDNVQMTAKTRHTWTVLDKPTERFARVEKVRVETLEPFKVVK